MGMPPDAVEALRAAAAAGAVAVAALGTGGRLLPRLARPGRWGAAERGAVSFALGLAVLSAAAALLGLAGMLRPWAAAAVLLPGGASALLSGGAAVRRRLRAPWRPSWLGWTEAALLAAAATAAGAGLLASLLPVVYFDSLVAHAFLPDVWAAGGRITTAPWSTALHNVQGAHALYALAILLGPGAAAQALHALCGLGALAGTYALGARLAAPGATGEEGEAIEARAGLVALLLAATIPGVVFLFHVLMVDFVAAALGVAFLLVLLRWLDGEGGLAAAAALLGGAVAAKYPSAAWIPLAAAAALLRSGARDAARLSAALLAGVALLAAPWLVRNAVALGAPLFPLVGGPPRFVVETAPWAATPGGWTEGLRAAAGLRGIEVGGLAVAAVPGVVLGWRSLAPSGRALVAAALGGLLLWAGSRDPWVILRFHLAGYLAVAAAAGAGLGRRRRGILLAVAVAAANALVGWTHAETRSGALATLFGPRTFAEYRLAHDPGADVRRAAADSAVLALGPRAYGLGPRAVVPFVDDAAIADAFFERADAGEAAARLRAAGFTHLLVDLPDLRRFRAQYGAFAACDPDSGALAEALRTWTLAAAAPRDRGLLLEVPAD